MSKKRSKRRRDEVGEAFHAMREERATATKFATAPDEALFFEDKGKSAVGALAAAQAAIKAKAVKGKGKEKPHKAKALAHKRRNTSKPRPPPKPLAGFMEPDHDPWADEVVPPSKRRIKSMAKKAAALPKVAVPVSGTSYNPEFEAHQDALGSVVAAEMHRDHRRKEMREFITPDPNYFKDVATDEETADEDGEGGDGGDGMGAGAPAPHKAPKALTTVQRNRRARLRAEEEVRAKKKKEKAFLAQLERLKAIQKEIVEHEAYQAERRDAIAILKLRSEEERVARILRTRRADVALSSELTGSLRTTKVGNPTNVIRDRITSLVQRRMTKITKGPFKGKTKKAVRILRNK